MASRKKKFKRQIRKMRDDMHSIGLEPERDVYNNMVKTDEGPRDKHLFIHGTQTEWHTPVSWCYCRPKIVRWDRMTNIRVYVHPSIIH